MVPLGESHTAKSQYSCRIGWPQFQHFIHIDQRTLLELKLLDSGLVGGNGCALDAYRVLLDSLGSIKSDLVVGLVSVRETEIVVLEVDIEITFAGEDQ